MVVRLPVDTAAASVGIAAFITRVAVFGCCQYFGHCCCYCHCCCCRCCRFLGRHAFNACNKSKKVIERKAVLEYQQRSKHATNDNVNNELAIGLGQ